MTNAQEWLNSKFPNPESKERVEKLVISVDRESSKILLSSRSSSSKKPAPPPPPARKVLGATGTSTPEPRIPLEQREPSYYNTSLSGELELNNFPNLKQLT